MHWSKLKSDCFVMHVAEIENGWLIATTFIDSVSVVFIPDSQHTMDFDYD